VIYGILNDMVRVRRFRLTASMYQLGNINPTSHKIRPNNDIHQTTRNIVSGSTAACRYPAVSTHARHSNSGLFTVKTTHWNLELFSTTQHTHHPYTMRLTSIVSAFALLFSAASALEKPLDIQVDKAVECTRKTKSGKRHPCQSPRSKAY